MTVRTIVVVLCIGASGCSTASPSKARISSLNSPVVWTATQDHGDKPGNGFKIVQGGGKLTAAFFMLDANKLDDFGAGRQLKTETEQLNNSELLLIVHIDDTRTDKLVLHFESALEGDRVAAHLRALDSEGDETTLSFVRQK